MASLLLVANDSHARTTACVVSDACRCDSLIFDVADDAETEADTDARYAGAIAVSAVGVPSVTLVHPTMAIRTVARQPIARAPIRSSRDTRPARHPISTIRDVTGS
jgi:hypothetical protein